MPVCQVDAEHRDAAKQHGAKPDRRQRRIGARTLKPSAMDTGSPRTMRAATR